MRKKNNAPDSLAELLGEKREQVHTDVSVETPVVKTMPVPAKSSETALTESPSRTMLTVRMSQDLHYELKTCAIRMQRKGNKDLASANAIVIKAVEEFLASHQENEHD